MLSAETAAGQYPVEAVRMMKAIAMSVEASDIFKTLMHNNVLTQAELLAKACLRIEDAVHFATMDLADKVCARYLVGFTNTGSSVLGLAKFRPLAPLIAFSPKPATLRRLALVWGVEPLQLGAVALGGRSAEFRHGVPAEQGPGAGRRDRGVHRRRAGWRVRRREHDQGGQGGTGGLSHVAAWGALLVSCCWFEQFVRAVVYWRDIGDSS